MTDFAIVGSGIGGSASAALLQQSGREVRLFEKEPYLGGCSGTFSRKGRSYNTGATTFAGYEHGHGVKRLFDTVGAHPMLRMSDPSLVVVQRGKTIRRFRRLDAFLDEVERVHPNTRNHDFWTLVHRICREFYLEQDYYYSRGSALKTLRSLCSFVPMALRYREYLLTDAHSFIRRFFRGSIKRDYMEFMDAQILIAAQATSRDVNFLTAALALGYTFNANHYVPGGMGYLFDALTSKIDAVHTRCPVKRIERHADRYVLEAGGERYEARNVILNTTIYDSHRLFDDENIRTYHRRFEHLNNYQSAITLYMTIRSDERFAHHYQFILDAPPEHTISNALFVSFSDPDDDKIAPRGHYSVTASIHTDLREWRRDDPAAYRERKSKLQARLTQIICDTLGIAKECIVDAFAGTPATFERFIGRSQLGGNAMTMRNALPRLPANDTPIRGLYHVGDSVFAAQGWPGVVAGVHNLKRILDGGH